MKKYLVVLLAAAMLCFSVSAFAQNKAYELPEEVVTGEEVFEDKTLLTPGSVTVIKPQEMQGEQKSLQELLKRVPGMHIIETKGRGGHTYASVRGSSASQVSVFVDGVLMNLGTEGEVDLSTIPVQNVERIEVYRGYIPARFAGASIGGVINIITKKAEKREGHLSVGAASYGKRDGSFSYSAPLGDGHFFVGGNYDTTDGNFDFYDDANTEFTPSDDLKRERAFNGYTNKDILMKWSNKDWQLRFSYKDAFKDQPYPVNDTAFYELKSAPTLDKEQGVFSIGRRFRSGKVDWGIKADYLKQESIFDNPKSNINVTHFHNNFKTDRFGIALDASMPVGDNQLLEFLGNYSNERLHITGDRYDFQPLSGISDHGEDAYNLQLQDTITLNKAGTFWLTPVARYNSQDGEGKGSWGVGLTHKFADNWSAKATYGTYNRAPKMYEKYGDGGLIVPNPELLWEDGTQWDVGLEYKGEVNKVQLFTELTYFGRRSNNLIELVPKGPMISVYENVNKTEVEGLELEARAIWDKWELFVSGTLLRALCVEDKIGSEIKNGDHLPYKPEREAFVRLSRLFMKDRLSLFVEEHYFGKNYNLDPKGNVVIDDTTATNIGFHYKVNDQLKISGGVNDIFDQSYDLRARARENGPDKILAYPMQGLTYYLTLSWYF